MPQVASGGSTSQNLRVKYQNDGLPFLDIASSRLYPPGRLGPAFKEVQRILNFAQRSVELVQFIGLLSGVHAVLGVVNRSFGTCEVL